MTRNSTFARYGFAIAVTLVAAAIAALFPSPDTRPYYFSIGAIALATWYGGWRPGLMSTVLAAGLDFAITSFRGPSPSSFYVTRYIGFVCIAALVFALAALLKTKADALRRSSSQFAGIVQISDDAIMTINEQQKITLFNRAAENIFGYTSADAVGQPLDMLLPERFRPMHGAHVQGFSHSPEMLRSMNRRGIIYGRRKNGEEFPAEASISKFDAAGEKIMAVRLRDITERQRLEEQLRQSQKIEAVGRLAGGVAHDFNNLLGIIVGYTYLIQNSTDVPDVKESADQIMAAAEKAAGLTRQLLAFSRKQVLKPEILDLNQITDQLGKMIPRLVGEDVDVRIVHGGNLRPVKADPNQLEQVIINLVVNARDAMPNGGKLTIETGNAALDADQARNHDLDPGDYVLLAVSDTGHGMDEETRQHIFEPFFTTKEAGKGTGLGLATVYGIVRQSNGYIWVYSEPGQGTTFKIYFPASAEGVVRPVEAEVQQMPARGSETLLIVEDEERLRVLLTNVLRASGYTVLTAANGKDALRLARNNGFIQLLITDVVLPEMRGPDIAKKMAFEHPNMSILYMSGFTDNALIHSGSLPQSTAFLQKPFTPGVLLRKVREILDEAAGEQRTRRAV